MRDAFSLLLAFLEDAGDQSLRLVFITVNVRGVEEINAAIQTDPQSVERLVIFDGSPGRSDCPGAEPDLRNRPTRSSELPLAQCFFPPETRRPNDSSSSARPSKVIIPSGDPATLTLDAGRADLAADASLLPATRLGLRPRLTHLGALSALTGFLIVGHRMHETVPGETHAFQAETAFLPLRPVHWINLQGRQRACGRNPSRP